MAEMLNNFIFFSSGFCLSRCMCVRVVGWLVGCREKQHDRSVSQSANSCVYSCVCVKGCSQKDPQVHLPPSPHYPSRIIHSNNKMIHQSTQTDPKHSRSKQNGGKPAMPSCSRLQFNMMETRDTKRACVYLRARERKKHERDCSKFPTATTIHTDASFTVPSHCSSFPQTYIHTHIYTCMCAFTIVSPFHHYRHCHSP